MKIAKKNSFPVVEGQLSLLTSVPAELRNIIYEILFVGDKNQLLLHNTEVLHSRLSRTDDHDSESEYITDLVEFNEWAQAKVGTGRDFAQDMHPGLPLLLTCRQIYHEAASLLYGHNEFIFSRTIHEHDRAPFVMFLEPEQYSQFLYTPKWLNDLGTQAQFLRKVTIDIDPTCPSDCRYTYRHAERIDLLPFAHFLWRRAHPDCKIKIKHTGRLLTCLVYDDTHFFNAERLNNILDALVTRDVLSLKRCTITTQLLAAIYIDRRDLRSGSVVFKMSNGKESDQHMQFSISADGTTLKVPPIKPDRSRLPWSAVPYDVAKEILKLTMFDSDNVDIGMNDWDVHGPSVTGIFNFYNFRFWRLDDLWADKTITIHSSMINRVIVHAENFESFRQLTHNPRESSTMRWRLRSILMEGFHGAESVILNLTIYVSLWITRDDIRINIKTLLVPLILLNRTKGVILRINLYAEGRFPGTIDVPFENIYKIVFLTICEMLSRWPGEVGRDPKLEWPDIWINGWGRLLCVRQRVNKQGEFDILEDNAGAVYAEDFNPNFDDKNLCAYNQFEQLSKEEVKAQGVSYGSAVMNAFRPELDYDEDLAPCLMIFRHLYEHYCWGSDDI